MPEICISCEWIEYLLKSDSWNIIAFDFKNLDSAMISQETSEFSGSLISNKFIIINNSDTFSEYFELTLHDNLNILTKIIIHSLITFLNLLTFLSGSSIWLFRRFSCIILRIYHMIMTVIYFIAFLLIIKLWDVEPCAGTFK